MDSTTATLIVLALATSVAAAVRSTWSPCGLSMLSTITPLAEGGRRHRFAATAAWFIAGSVLGGAVLGSVAGLAAALVRVVHPPAPALAAVAVLGALVAAVSDSGLTGWSVPVHHRQVNERWLDRYRPWVYGAGFGFQIGVGLATYIMTAALYLTVLLAAATGRPGVGVAVGLSFGLVRGLAVLLGARLRTPADLRRFHQRFERLGPPIRVATVVVEAVVAVAAAWVLWKPAAGLVGLSVLSAWAVADRRRVARPAPDLDRPAQCGPTPPGGPPRDRAVGAAGSGV